MFGVLPMINSATCGSTGNDGTPDIASLIYACDLKVERGSCEMYGEPNGRLALRRPSYTMGTMSRNQNIVSRTKITFALSLDP